MEANKIIDILNKTEKSNIYKKIFINGTWGIGKSFYTSKYIENNSEKILYISLFGKNSIDTIIDSLTSQLLKKMDSIHKFSKQLKKLLKDYEGNISIFGVSFSSISIKNKSFLEEYANLLESKDLIIIFDDLERKSSLVSIEDIMGLIEELSILKNIKIILIGDEENIDKNNDLEKWKKFKEKIVEKEYKIDTFSNEAIDNIIIGKLNNLIDKGKLREYISTFFNIHKVKNLRTIEKGVNFFLEVINNYITGKYDQDVYLTVFANCIAVVVELTEELYKPNQNVDSKGIDSWEASLDKDIATRIINHYFESMLLNNRNHSLLKYIIGFYNSEITDEIIKDFNKVLESDIKPTTEKNIFYLSENEIILKVRKLYDSIANSSYKMTSVEAFLDDVYNLIKYNDVFSLKISVKEISKCVHEILFNQYYDIKKEEYQNQIDTFSMVNTDSPDLYCIINEYNDKASKKYAYDKIDFIVKKYKSKDLNSNYFSYFKQKFYQNNIDATKKEFFEKCKSNSFLIPDLSGELKEEDWSWTHAIWGVFYKYMPDNYKKELNDYAEDLKNKSSLCKYRIESLQKYKPLI